MTEKLHGRTREQLRACFPDTFFKNKNKYLEKAKILKKRRDRNKRARATQRRNRNGV